MVEGGRRRSTIEIRQRFLKLWEEQREQVPELSSAGR